MTCSAPTPAPPPVGRAGTLGPGHAEAGTAPWSTVISDQTTGDETARDDDARDEARTEQPAWRTVTQIGGTGGDHGDARRVSTGVLAADATARTRIERRRRWLVGGAVLGTVVVLAFVLGVTLASNLAEERARTEAELADAEAAFATQVVGRAEDYEQPARTTTEEAATLRTRLEDHLVVGSRVDADLTAEVEESAAAISAQVERIARLTERELPPIDPLIDLDDGEQALRELDQLRADAGALVEEAADIDRTVAAWSTSVVALDGALASHVAVVEQQPETTDPAALVEGWQSERAPLQTLAEAARTAAEQPGLEQWAQAHLDYAQRTLAFIDEAIPLLRDGSLDDYNELYRSTFTSDDPFGFRASARTGAAAALEAAPISTVADIGERASVVTQQLQRTERTVAERLGDAA